jgi:hypothetical protein
VIPGLNKKKKTARKSIKKSQMITSFEDLKMLAESAIVKKDLNSENEENKAPVRRNLSERIREKWHGKVFDKNKEDEKK